MAHDITLIQVGDVHYDELKSLSTTNDVKDPRAPGALVSTFQRPISPIVAEALRRRMEEGDHPIALICGDLTSRGSLTTYDEALAYLRNALGSTPPGPDRVHLVPGNHDVDYMDSMPYVDDSIGRFNVLEAHVTDAAFPCPLTSCHRAVQHKVGSGTVRITSINSCRACGAPRTIPSSPSFDLAVADELHISENIYKDAIMAAASKTSSPREILDIPMVHPEDLQQVVEPRPASLNVILAHHNFLPQATNRIQAYTEMINGGQVRRALLESTAPILYLHGHIHQDSVEVVTGGPEGIAGGPLVAIAAPTLAEGFNEVVVKINDHGVALGVTLVRHRVSLIDGMMRTRAPQMISFRATTPSARALRPAFAYLYTQGAALGQEIVEHVTKSSGAPPSVREIEEYVELLTWTEHVRSDPKTKHLPFEAREFFA